MELQFHKRRIHSGCAPEESLPEREIDMSEKLLAENLNEALRATGYFISVPCDVTLHVTPDGDVSLCGIVPSYYHKQKAQVAAMSVDGVRTVRNDLFVL